jgi:hypothetical protein
MAQRAWIITAGISENTRFIADVQSARKKIGQIEQYLIDVAALLGHEGGKPARLSGVALYLDCGDFMLWADLADCDGALYDGDGVRALDYMGMDYERFDVSATSLRARLDELAA